MQLSDAIALGRLLANGITADVYIHSDTNCACAIGMAQLANGLASHDERWVLDSWRWLLRGEFGTCPSCARNLDGIGGISAVSHVMCHVIGFTRTPGTMEVGYGLKKDITLDQLIDWVRSIEPPEQEKQTETVEVAEDSCERG